VFVVSPTYYGMTAAVTRALRLLRSTSPSSLLIASLDSARRQLAMHGEQLLHETLEAIAAAYAKRWTTCRRWFAAGARLHWASDPSFQTVTVLANGEHPS
jgi:arginine/lysine/ornithine decarboxylase